jgi:hypothetical protein
MKHLERAHDLAHAAARAVGEEAEPNAHLAPAATHLAHGLEAMYDAFDGRADRSTSMNLAHGRLWEAAVLVARAGLPRAVGAIRDACAELVTAEEGLPRVPLATSVTDALQAGADVPVLHALTRPSIVPAFRAPPVPELVEDVPPARLPEPTTFAELAAAAEAARKLAAERIAARAPKKASPVVEEAPPPAPEPLEPPPGFAYMPPAPMPEDEFVQRWARECFDEVGMLGLQRAPLPGDSFRGSLSLEKRLVAAIDAIAALGPTAVAYLEPLAMDVPVVNPMAVFAITMIGGCLEGRDALAAAERVAHHFGPNDPAVAGPFASALKLAPNPFVPSLLRTLAASKELGCRPLAVDVLASRGWLTGAELSALADEEDPRVLALALPALAVARHPDLGRALGRAREHADRRVQEAALDAMLLAAHPEAASAARAAAVGALGDAALSRLAVVADRDDAVWLLGRMQAGATREVVEAVGWAGLVEAVPALLALLEAEEEDVQRAAGAALDRLLGANLVERVQVMPEEIEDVPVVDPDPEPARGRASLAALVSDPRDLPPPGSAEDVEVPSADPEAWRAFWAEHQHRFDPKLRLRRGNPYSPSVSLYELDQLPLGVEDRRRLHVELAARTGKVTRFDPHDFVRVQEQSLAAWAALIQAMGETPGSWSRPVVW